MTGQGEGGKDREPFDPHRRSAASSGAGVAGAGLQFAAALLIFLFVGQWLDRRLGTEPWLMILGVFLGGAGGFYAMYRTLMAQQEREEAARKERSAR